MVRQKGAANKLESGTPTNPALPVRRLAVILCFRAKSERLGKHNETTRTSSSWPGSWKSSGSLRQYYYYSASHAIARFYQNLACCCSDLQSKTLFVEHYTCIIPVKLPDYSRIMFYAFTDQLFQKLCQHIRRISRDIQCATTQQLRESYISLTISPFCRPPSIKFLASYNSSLFVIENRSFVG